jgi:hypothetical protein
VQIEACLNIGLGDVNTTADAKGNDVGTARLAQQPFGAGLAAARTRRPGLHRHNVSGIPSFDRVSKTTCIMPQGGRTPVTPTRHAGS